MKRVFSICLAVVLLFSTAGCSGKSLSGTTNSTSQNKNEITIETGADTNPIVIQDETGASQSSGSATTNTTPYLDASLPTQTRVADLLARMTLEEKAGQMVQGVIGTATQADMTKLGLGSVLSGGGAVPGDNSLDAWSSLIKMYQEGAMQTRLKIPFIYGIDAVHGHSNVYGAVVFPQNIGLGAANDPIQMYAMGAAVAEEMKLTHTLWNFSPCIAVAQDPRWGRV